MCSSRAVSTPGSAWTTPPTKPPARPASPATRPPLPVAAQQAATAALAHAGVDCDAPSVAVDTGDFTPGGMVTVTVSCRLDLSYAAALLATADQRTLTATATSPIDTYRAVTP